ncbi:hypothetical protein SAMN05444123_107117 [Rhodopseudomonas pseudopalustris]|uniref:Uncharacterized protein n=1 Tax=Rhodopseudomonas pseudopalustris TaxID=1513892 RepID=A0A1H8UKW1_9BRAD|nr:hypothetical protein SAMN05444123_107117 [Rhodopseudomonas pseudopalustris]
MPNWQILYARTTSIGNEARSNDLDRRIDPPPSSQIATASLMVKTCVARGNGSTSGFSHRASSTSRPVQSFKGGCDAAQCRVARGGRHRDQQSVENRRRYCNPRRRTVPGWICPNRSAEAISGSGSPSRVRSRRKNDRGEIGDAGPHPEQLPFFPRTEICLARVLGTWAVRGRPLSRSRHRRAEMPRPPQPLPIVSTFG